MKAPVNKVKEELDDEYDWIRIQAKIEQTKVAEVGVNRLTTLMVSNPFVPIGCASTVTALILGLRNFYKSDHKKQQVMMRARVGAQGFTVLALVGGVFYHAFKDQQ